MDKDREEPIPLETHYLPAERSSAAQIQESAELLAANKLLTSMMETMPGGAVVLDENHQIVAINKVLCGFLGFDNPEELLGVRPGELLGCKLPPTMPGGCGTTEACRECGLVNTVVEAIETNKTKQGECRIALASGDALDLAIGATAHNISGKPFVFVGVHDISGTKRRQVLETTFMHDLMNTAAGIQGMLHLLKEQLAEVDESGLTATSHRLAQYLIEEIQAHKQLVAAEQGDLLLKSTPIDIRDLLGETISLYKNHEVGLDRTLALCQVCDATVDTDPSILRRIIGNMVKNALEATPEGGTVALEATEEDDAVAFHVTNPTGRCPKAS